MENRQLIIDLNNFRSSKSAVFAGRERGYEVRKKITDERLNSANKIRFVIPDDVYAINSSFLLGLLGDTIRIHQKNKEDVSNIIEIPEDFKRTFEDAIREAGQVKNLL